MKTLLPLTSPPPGVSILADAMISAGKLVLSYEVRDLRQVISWPEPTFNPTRKDQLWEFTCMEAFLLPQGAENYWEINISPWKDWNVYAFSTYRKKMRREAKVTEVFSRIDSTVDVWKLSCELDVRPFFPPKKWFRVGLAAVIRTKDGGTHYWALRHPAPQADFHLVESFTHTLRME